MNIALHRDIFMLQRKTYCRVAACRRTFPMNRFDFAIMTQKRHNARARETPSRHLGEIRFDL
jgi:hypothetical protein